MSVKQPLKQIPTFESDRDAEDFVERADLTEYDLSGFRRSEFEFAVKDTTVSLRMPASLVQSLKRRAAVEGIPYQRLIRLFLEQGLAQPPR